MVDQSKLPPDIAHRLSAGGISIADQNRWFWHRVGDSGIAVGAEFENHGGVITLICGDWTAEQLNKRFYDGLVKAFGYNWKIIGVRGHRSTSDPDNAAYGPASKPLPRSEAEEISFQREKVREFDEWVVANKATIKSMEIINAARAFVVAGLDRAEAKLAAAGQNSVDPNSFRRYDID